METARSGWDVWRGKGVGVGGGAVRGAGGLGRGGGGTGRDCMSVSH